VLFDSVRGRASGAARAEPGTVALRVEGQSIAAPAPVTWQVAGRTMGDLIVSVAADSEASARALLGQQRVVRLESAHALLLNGQIVQ
jgi:hypothetical protein